MVDTFFFFGVMAGVVQLVGYWVYVKGDTETNIGSWLIWTMSAAVDVYYFDYVTQSNFVKEILPAVCGIACIMTFLIMCARGRFGWPEMADWIFIGFDVTISLAWWLDLTDGLTANFLIQASTVISAIPMVRGIRNGKATEHQLPWLIWTLAYVLHLVTVLLELKSLHETLYPLANIVMHGWILLTIIKYSKRSVATD